MGVGSWSAVFARSEEKWRVLTWTRVAYTGGRTRFASWRTSPIRTVTFFAVAGSFGWAATAISAWGHRVRVSNEKSGVLEDRPHIDEAGVNEDKKKHGVIMVDNVRPLGWVRNWDRGNGAVRC